MGKRGRKRKRNFAPADKPAPVRATGRAKGRGMMTRKANRITRYSLEEWLGGDFKPVPPPVKSRDAGKAKANDKFTTFKARGLVLLRNNKSRATRAGKTWNGLARSLGLG